jgi:hypothetical protein
MIRCLLPAQWAFLGNRKLSNAIFLGTFSRFSQNRTADGSDQPTRHSIGQLAFPKAVSRAFTAAIAIPRT